jgi:orotidine-5'-phosphate decarboxylase
MQTIPKTPWLLPEEHAEVVQFLYNHGLLKFSNKRDLPLKSGGKTDVYINLRDARNDPKAIKFIAELFEIPLRRLNLDRFIEIPDSVSTFAGPLSINTGIPYLTIRGEVKEGRVSDAKMIGNPKPSETVCIIDDVITDGTSKIAAYQLCKQLNLNLQSLIVLVDRQQGWKTNLAKYNCEMPVWPGMTLHDVRKQLVELGIMQRCTKEAEEKNPIIVALDGKSWEEILPLADQLRNTGCILKVNDLLFDEGIKNLLPNLSVYGRVMADLKGHDIPNTVSNTCRKLKACPPWAVTIHASGGEEMLKAALKELEGTNTKVLAVTVLTSIDEKTCEEVYTRLPLHEVIKLAEIANRAGVHGFVCSPEEVATLSASYPDKEFVTPGIRSEGKDKGDQNRTGTPAGAIANGATKLVMGRQLLNAPDPITEVMRVLNEELGIKISL